MCGFRGAGCPLGAILQGMQYAADIGAAVVNMSIAGPAPRAELRGFESVLNRAINYLHRKGTLLVVAAGNEAIDYDHQNDLFSFFCDAP
ncbi:MAG TPA: S8 family serine peptidase, partial [Gemmatimonadales bacterium]|nr:S8 family serine peptidase [Gemmatimonadales bacterium]